MPLINQDLTQSILLIFNKKNFTGPRSADGNNCLATDACLNADPGVAAKVRSRPRSHTFVEIDHEIISTLILLPSADSHKKGCCQLQAKVCARSTGYNGLFKLAQEKVWFGELPILP